MGALGFEQFGVAGHDRGGRVAYRMALDHPDRVRKLATLDIVPTLEQFERMGMSGGMGSFHWYFLAQPAPFPERMIGADPEYFMRHLMTAWAASPYAFAPEAMAEYARCFRDRSEEHMSELQSLMSTSYAVFSLEQKTADYLV